MLTSPRLPLQVLEYMHSDLEAVIKDGNLVLAAADVKSYMQQLLTALETCHSRWAAGHRGDRDGGCNSTRGRGGKRALRGNQGQWRGPGRNRRQVGRAGSWQVNHELLELALHAAAPSDGYCTVTSSPTTAS